MKYSFAMVAGVFLFASFVIVWKTLEAKKNKNQALLYSRQLQASHSAFNESVYYNTKDLILKTQYFIDEKLDTIDLHSIFLGKEQKIVLRIKENSCMDCVDSIFSKLLSFSGKIDDGKIIVLALYTNINDIIRFKQIRNLPFRIYCTNNTLFKEDNEVGELPFLFLLDSSMHANSLFTAKTEQSAATDIYLKTIKQRLDEEYDIQMPITSPKITSIGFEKKSFNLGNIKYGSQAVAIARFTNTGHKPLYLTAVTADCGCTEVSFPRTAILPGDSSFISIHYDSHREGTFDRNVYVYSNAKESPVSLKITGQVTGRE